MDSSFVVNSTKMLVDHSGRRKYDHIENTVLNKRAEKKPYFRTKLNDILWINVFVLGGIHIAAVYGFYLLVSRQAKLVTFILGYTYGVIGGMGVICGSHRLWSHRSYEANTKLRFLLALTNLIAYQNSIYHWVRDHRLHHKFSDTDADPHNPSRGFFFSQVGWLLVKKHPEVLRKGPTIDMSDIKNDSIVMFQKKYYALLMPIFCFILPTVVPVYFVGETWWNSWFIASILRYVITLNATWSVNSFAHKFGTRPMDRSILPSNNGIVSLIAYGEGWHNFHHVFPWDYRSEELGSFSLNFSTKFIEFFARIGWAYNLKTASKEIIEKRANRTGDGTSCHHKLSNQINASTKDETTSVWGWNDTDLKTDDKKSATISNKM